MRFGRVHGHGRRVMQGEEALVSLAVMLDAGSSVRVVRDESVPWLPFGPDSDTAWQVDQLTQETIGTVLADEGWEAISEEPGQHGDSTDGLVHSAVYVVRNLSSTFGSGGDAS